MDKKEAVSGKIQLLSSTYQNINDEGRDALDKVIQKLAEINGEPERIKEIEQLAFFESSKGKKASFNSTNNRTAFV